MRDDDCAATDRHHPAGPLGPVHPCSRRLRRAARADPSHGADAAGTEGACPLVQCHRHRALRPRHAHRSPCAASRTGERMNSPYLTWFGIVRLGLVQTALGAIVVLTTSTINRVLVVELALPAVLPRSEEHTSELQ